MSRKTLFLVFLVCTVAIGFTIAKGRRPNKPKARICTEENKNVTCALFCETNTCEDRTCVCSSPLLRQCARAQRNTRCGAYARRNKSMIVKSCKDDEKGMKKGSYCVAYSRPKKPTDVEPENPQVPEGTDPAAPAPDSTVRASSENKPEL